MTTKLKERIVALSRNEKARKVFNIYLFIALVVIIVSFFITELDIIARIIAAIALLGIYISFALQAIKKQTDEVINDNKLIYIILSDIDAVEHYILFLVNIPILIIVFSFIELNVITGILYFVIALISISKFSKVISRYFKNKLSKNNDWWEKTVRRDIIF